MRTLLPLISAVALYTTGLFAAPIQHEFLAIDEGANNLFYVNEKDPSHHWLVKVGKKMPRDMQLIGQGRVLIAHDQGYTEYDIATGNVLLDVTPYTGVTSARRLPSGNTLLGGVDLDGSKGIVLMEVDPKGAVVRKMVFPGNYLRLVRETAIGTYLLVSDTQLKEVDHDGRLLSDRKIEGFTHAWKAVRLPSGNIFVSAGYGVFLAELDANGNILRKIGAKESAPPDINAHFYATDQLLPNGDVVVANWQGHGPGHGASGVQLLEYDPKGNIVWRWSQADMISSLQGILVLDGLNTALLHDERNGIMEPLTAK